MDVASLIKYIVILVAVLGVLVIFYVLPNQSRSKEKKQDKEVQQEEIPSLNHLSSIVNNSRSTSEQLGNTLDLVIKHYGVMPPKVGVRSDPSIDIYKFLISRLCRHPNTNKDLIIKFTNSLEKLNSNYKKEINKSLMEGLNSRAQ